MKPEPNWLRIWFGGWVSGRGGCDGMGWVVNKTTINTRIVTKVVTKNATKNLLLITTLLLLKNLLLVNHILSRSDLSFVNDRLIKEISFYYDRLYPCHSRHSPTVHSCSRAASVSATDLASNGGDDGNSLLSRVASCSPSASCSQREHIPMGQAAASNPRCIPDR